MALASQPVRAQVGEAAVVVVKVYYSGIRTGHILISRGPNSNEEIEFTDNKPNVEAEKLQGVIAKLHQEGFRLRSTISRSEGQSPLLIFEKD